MMLLLICFAKDPGMSARPAITRKAWMISRGSCLPYETYQRGKRSIMTQHDWFYHVTTQKKLERYNKTGSILPPVRAWEKIEDALDFSFRTGRQIILRIRLSNPKRLEGHKGKAMYSDYPTQITSKYKIKTQLCKTTQGERQS